LGLVVGLPEVLVERALPLVTVYSGAGKVNVMDAAPEVIAALPGMTPDLLHTVLVQRTAAPQNGDILMSLLGPAQGDATVEASRAMRVTVFVSFDNGRRTAAEVVIYIGDNDAEPYRVLSWRDEFDEALIH
jgi:general secretion pathway protein K